MYVKTFPVGVFQCNCTLLIDENTGEAIVIDPGDEGERIADELHKKQCRVKYIIHTHAHIDHIGATKAVKQACGGEICLHRDDLFLYENIAMQGRFLGVQIDEGVLPVDHYLHHGDRLECQNVRTKVLHTPGHTPGSLSFLFENLPVGAQKTNLLFSGDTLFMGSIGRTDLWGGDYDQIIASIKSELLTLPPETVVITGHGPNTTIARERKYNPFLL